MSGNRLAGAVAGGLVAGLGLTALLVVGEKRSGKPSELVDLARQGARNLGARNLGLRVPAPEVLPSAREHWFVQRGHLLLSAAAGAAYAAATEERAPAVSSGLLFGAAFYAAMHWVAGPLLGVKKPEWTADPGTLGMHTVNHLAFGLITAAGAKLATRRS